MRYGSQSLLLEISFLDDDFLLIGEGCHCLFDGAFGLCLFESELRVTVNDGIVDEVYADFSATVHLAVTVDCSAGHDFAQKCESVAHIEKAGSDFVNVRPEIILLDEPTGNLDSVNSEGIMRLLSQINSDFGTTIIQVTHNEKNALYGTRVITISDGKIVSSEDIPSRIRPEERSE